MPWPWLVLAFVLGRATVSATPGWDQWLPKPVRDVTVWSQAWLEVNVWKREYTIGFKAFTDALDASGLDPAQMLGSAAMARIAARRRPRALGA